MMQSRPVPSSKSLLSYLHRSPGTSTPDDSSSVESEIDEVMDNVVVNTAAKKSDDAVQEVTTSAAVKNRNKMKKNGIAKDMEPRMKKVSVEMKKMRKERWSLDTGGSSGDEGGRVVAGFSPASASERGVRSKQAAYRKLIGSLEQELEDEERAMTPPPVSALNNPPLVSLDFEIKSPGATSSPVPPVDFDIEVEEVKEEKAPLMVRLVEDFRLQSESDDEDEYEEEVVEIKSEMMTAVQQPLDDIKEPSIEINDVEVKKEVTEEEEEKVLMYKEDEILVDEKSKWISWTLRFLR